MGFGSPIHWIILGIIAIVLFGGGRFPQMMGDVAKGLKSFKKGMADEDEDHRAAPPAAPIPPAPRLQQPAATDRPVDRLHVDQPHVDHAPVDHGVQPVRDERPGQP